ncbi:hypothetical protein BHE74_00048022 [Ensete ventricosum]|nr:hypothetical protein GW17_00049321 [Ensete ventricosum]RWW46058.1 hypothetical protein BHE74_00048022 [Ensete ventricosum]RZS26083.1 hypothetical protein BHM03_00059383 [Ensete ventricosum]
MMTPLVLHWLLLLFPPKCHLLERGRLETERRSLHQKNQGTVSRHQHQYKRVVVVVVVVVMGAARRAIAAIRRAEACLMRIQQVKQKSLLC